MSTTGFVVRVGVIVVVGVGIGVLDAFAWRPVQLQREGPSVDVEELIRQRRDAVRSQQQPAAADREVTERVVPKPPEDPSPEVVVTPEQATADPGEFRETPRDRLPSGHITVTQARELWNIEAQFVDARGVDKYLEGHIPGAFRMLLQEFLGGTPRWLDFMDRETPTVVYCGGGDCEESEGVAKMLEQSGFRNVYILHDGFPGWKGMGHPVQEGSEFE